ncbi:MAG: E3 binding domain-containing protein [Acidimicrobiia bacterium]|nr:E3 binding domain-containing protein [Acidimicrobiia bacterium]
MARRRRRRKSSYEQARSSADGSNPQLILEELSPRARRLVESGLIDVDVVAGTGEGGKVTSGDILHAARVMEVEQSVARIEAAHLPQNGDEASPDESEATLESDEEEVPPVDDSVAEEHIANEAADTAERAPDDGGEPLARENTVPEAGSTTFTSVNVEGEPIAVDPDRWEEYNGSTDGFSERARVGAEQSWGEAEAHLAAMEEAAVPAEPDLGAPVPGEPAMAGIAPGNEVSAVDSDFEGESHVGPDGQVEPAEVVPDDDDGDLPSAPVDTPMEVMMDFGTLELVDPESVWAQGAEDFAPWFLAHSQQLGDVLGLRAGLSDARQFTTKSATGVLGRDDNGEDVVVVSSQRATADDSDLGRALGMAASSGAASVALVSAALHEDQLKALAWLNNQTKSGVKWYGIEMRVVRIADSPAAMLFDLVASPPQGDDR